MGAASAAQVSPVPPHTPLRLRRLRRSDLRRRGPSPAPSTSANTCPKPSRLRGACPGDGSRPSLGPQPVRRAYPLGTATVATVSRKRRFHQQPCPPWPPRDIIHPIYVVKLAHPGPKHVVSDSTRSIDPPRRRLSTSRTVADGGGCSENRDTLCRNITIYGHCRYEDTCAFNHDMNKPPPNNDT